MTAPARGRDDATIRGAVVLVVAIVIGLALLARSGGGGDDAAAEATTTPRPGGSITTVDTGNGSTLPPIDDSVPDPGVPPDTQPPESVAVVVFNGTPDRVPGIAGEFNDKAAAAGYQMLAATNANAPTDVTTIFAASGFEADAEAMKVILGLPNATVEVKPEESLGAGDELADIVVVLGADYAG